MERSLHTSVLIEDVDKDRQYSIDACIVQIMKSRTVLSHAQLVECVEQLGRMFNVTIIEWLIYLVIAQTTWNVASFLSC